jgi:hypothetical protein
VAALGIFPRSRSAPGSAAILAAHPLGGRDARAPRVKRKRRLSRRVGVSRGVVGGQHSEERIQPRRSDIT